MREIPSSNLVCFDDFVKTHPVRVDLVYADADHKDNIFGEAIYKADAKIWCHKDLAEITLKAAEIIFDKSGYICEIKDALRPFEAQARMQQTAIVKANPHWCEEPDRLLSPPGKGGHPRGMAVDLILVAEDGREVDMGTPFDYLTEDRKNNPAARNYIHFSDEVLENRKLLEDGMMQAAKFLGHQLLPLPQEWWDFRFPKVYTDGFKPILNKNLPESMKMMA